MKTKTLTRRSADRSRAMRVAALSLAFITVLFGPSSEAVAQQISYNFSALTGVTAIPGGSGTFVGYPPNPSISLGAISFLGQGSGGQLGIYMATPPDPMKVVADINTLIPGGSGTFLAYPPDPMISGSNVAFLGLGANGQQGIYVSWEGLLTRVADLNTAIPGGTGNFTQFQPVDPVISGADVVFWAGGANGQQGIYAYWTGSLWKIADLNTLVPGTTSHFTGFPVDPIISGVNVAFVGSADALIGGDLISGSGVYLYPNDPAFPTDPIKIADSSTDVPNQPAGTLFSNFFSLSLSGTNVAFAGAFSSGSGVYVCHPPDPCEPAADTSTLVPGSSLFFSGFGNVAIDPSKVVFEGFGKLTEGEQTIKGIYEWTGNMLTKIAAQGDTIGGKQIADLHFGHGGFSGNQVAFSAAFTDGSQGIVTATNGGNRCPLSLGYWKNHVSVWPETTLTLGSQNYSQTELLNLMSLSTSDASIQLAQQLIAAKLNVFQGSNVDPTSDAINGADSLLAVFAGNLPYGVKPSSSRGQAMVNDANILINYNAGKLTPVCVN